MAVMSKSVFSECLALPKNSPQHIRLREELWLGGASHACRYYLSIILGRELFATSDDEFLKAAQEYIVAKTCPEAIQFCCTPGHFQFVMPFLKREWEVAEGTAEQRRLKKVEQCLVLLLNHPDWTDEQIRKAVKTTDKQMKRWGTFNAARAAHRHFKDGAEGWR